MSGDLPSPDTTEISTGPYGPASLLLDGRILIHAEQGFGDTLQFVRYVPAVAERGGRVVLEVPAPLVRLARTVAGASQVVAAGDPLPAFDCHCPLLSLPRVFKTNLATIPGAVPYLSVPAEASAAWAERIATAPGLRVGVVWAGTTVGAIDLRLLQPLWEVAGVSWFSLQVGDRSGDLSSARRREDRRPLAVAHGFRRNRGRGLSPGSGDKRRHLGRASGGRTRAADMALVAVCAGLAMAARARRQPLVSDGATVPPEEGGGLACVWRARSPRPLRRWPAEASYGTSISFA